MLSNKSKSSDKEQGTLVHFVEFTKEYGPKDLRQLLISQKLVCYKAEDLLPLSTEESRSFRALVSSLDPRYSVPSRKHLSSVLIRDRCSELYDSVKEHLKDVKELSLIMDIWPN